ncbi:MAG: hypothetical protein RRA92_07125 [Gemmatimonadota bacterium]|nr:hypothetical protein [Gemmatimonadota bacterium]
MLRMPPRAGSRAPCLPLAVLLLLPAPPGAAPAGAQEATPDDPVAAAVVALPPELRDGATVLGSGGEPRPGDVLTTLRGGTNDLVCLADDPAVEGFRVACYHRDLDPYMALGRRLRAGGADRQAVLEGRFAALEAGDLAMPRVSALYVFTADGVPDPTRPDEAPGARRRTVVYVPGATLEETGLPGRPAGDGPWLMLPGTPWAHIMIDG